MVVVGAVHITQALAPMAVLLGYEVTVVDPRRAFATDERFPGVAVDTEWPDDALLRLAPDRRTAVVTLTHDPKLDDPALAVALASDAFYIGSLGSRRTHAARLERLAGPRVRRDGPRPHPRSHRARDRREVSGRDRDRGNRGDHREAPGAGPSRRRR